MDTPQNNNPLNCNRRDFIKYAGMGVAAFSVGGMMMSSNAGAASISSVSSDELDSEVLIIGGGVAATFAAIKAAEQGAKVT